jgi:cell division protein FtsI/penicillin-binding protein 2
LRKKIAILAVAAFWLFSTDFQLGSAPQSPQSRKASTPSSKSVVRPSGRTPVLSKTTKTKRTSVRRRGRRRNPWRVSSFGEPTTGDNPAGENPAVREAAIEALGNWNGSVVVVDPNTGRILSIVNQQLALGSAFTPCSTFKPVVALAALKEGLITPETELRVGRRRRMNVTDALAHSNNRFFSKLGQQLGFRRLAEYARAFGFGQKAGLDIPGESAGRFPAQPPKDGSVGFMSSYGKNIEVTALQMAAVISAIANGGTLYHLQYPRTPEEIAQFEPKVRHQLDDLAEHFPQIKEGLAAAVIYGTARLAYDPEEQIYGKTGTCSEDGARLGWFVSYANEQQPKYVVVVLLRGGRLMYGPHAAEIGGRLYRSLRQREQPATQASRINLPFSQFPPQ